MPGFIPKGFCGAQDKRNQANVEIVHKLIVSDLCMLYPCRALCYGFQNCDDDINCLIKLPLNSPASI